MSINLIIKQPNNSTEARAASFFGMISSGVEVKAVDFNHLQEFTEALSRGSCIPIGSVEYVRKAMGLAGIKEPKNQSYPACLREFLNRKIEIKKAKYVEANSFVKPFRTKLFNGFVFRGGDANNLDDHDQQQNEVFEKIDQNELVWSSSLVDFLSEWRFYVRDNNIIGLSRYDQKTNEDATSPDMAKVEKMIAALKQDREFRLNAYALDVGVLSDGETAVVEVNDAWALGLYSKGMDRRVYIEMLIHRWRQMRSAQSESFFSHKQSPVDLGQLALSIR